MNFLTIISGVAVLGISGFVGLVAALLFMEGGVTPIFGGIAMSVVAVMTLALGVILIGIGWSGFVAHIRNSKA